MRPMHPRPLSPHLQIYRPQLTSVLSILHRASGVFLALGLLPLAWWLTAAADGAEAFAKFHRCAQSLAGRALLLAWTFCFFYHLCNGVRHLCWDMGAGFSLRAVYIGGWLVVAASAALTAAAFLAAYGVLP